MTSQLIQKAVSEIKKIPSTCGICKKKGVNTYGECECSYEDKGLIKRKDVIDALSQIITGVIEEIVNKLQYRIDVNHLVKDMDIVSPQEIVDLTQDELINTLKEVVKE